MHLPALLDPRDVVKRHYSIIFKWRSILGDTLMTFLWQRRPLKTNSYKQVCVAGGSCEFFSLYFFLVYLLYTFFFLLEWESKIYLAGISINLMLRVLTAHIISEKEGASAQRAP